MELALEEVHFFLKESDVRRFQMYRKVARSVKGMPTYSLSRYTSQQYVPPLYFVSVYMVAQMAKNLPTMPEIQIRSLGQEDLLEEGMATHSSIIAWRIPWTEEPGGL